MDANTQALEALTEAVNRLTATMTAPEALGADTALRPAPAPEIQWRTAHGDGQAVVSARGRIPGTPFGIVAQQDDASPIGYTLYLTRGDTKVYRLIPEAV